MNARTMFFDAAEHGIPTDGQNIPIINNESVWYFLVDHAPRACRFERVTGGIRCWESVADYEQWCQQS